MKSEELKKELQKLLSDFESLSPDEDVRKRVLKFVPVFETVRELGKSLIPQGLKLSARERLLEYLKRYPGTIIDEKELAIVAGISEWARRVRELRVQFGWKIISGVTAREMVDEEEISIDELNVDESELSSMRPNNYMLADTEPDRDAAYRWNVANEIRRRKDLSMRDRILDYFRKNVGKQINGEELRYVAQGSEWARRVRELRTEEGWPVTSRMNGRPDLPVGVYVLEKDRQTPVHDRKIQDRVRREVLKRDEYKCTECGWTHDDWNPSDPRHLEIHHIKPHAEGGRSSIDNLTTVCNICHDRIHVQEN